MRKHLQAKAALFVFVAVVGLGWSILAAPVALTVMPYADLVRFAAQGTVREFQVEILSLSGQKLFDSGTVNSSALDWRMGNLNGRTVASGVYLYAITVKDSSGNVTKQFGKLALVRGQGTIAPPIITTPTIGNQVQPKFTQCANPCAETHQGDITIQTSTGTPWAFFDSTNQRLGVGTTSPTAGLHVLGAINPLQLLESSSASFAPKIQFKNVSGNQWHFGAFGSIDKFSIARTAVQDYIVVDRTVTPTTIQFLAANVGLGTTSPAAQAHVVNTSNQPALRVDSNNGTNAIEVYNTGAGAATGLIYRVERATGNVYADGSFNCGLISGSCFNAGTGADVAERIDAVEAMEAGDVVEIHPDQAGKFRKSQSAISRRVAGIISTAPAVTLGNNFNGNKEKWSGDNRPLLALAGRVPVKVLAKYGAIQIGDLLVSSPIPGYAMKCPEASQCIGAVIGKALEPLAEGVGKIEVQVMLR